MLLAVNYFAVLIAAILGFVITAGWYSLFWSKVWSEVVGLTELSLQKQQSAAPFILAFAADCIMAWTIAVLLGSIWPLQTIPMHNGALVGALVWFGFTITALSVNYLFAARSLRSLAIDGGNWLIVLMVMGMYIAHATGPS